MTYITTFPRFLLEPSPRFMLQLSHFLPCLNQRFESTVWTSFTSNNSRSLGGFGTTYGSRKGSTRRELGGVEQDRFQRNIYLRVVGMWQRRRREAASWPQYRREEEGVGGPPEPVWPPIRTRGQPLVSSLAADDSVNDAPTPLPRSRLSGRICDQPWAERECGHLCVS